MLGIVTGTDIFSPYVAILIAISTASTSILGIAQAFFIAGAQLCITVTVASPFNNASGVLKSNSSFAVIGYTAISPDSGTCIAPSG